jgi:hypothetical protein
MGPTLPENYKLVPVGLPGAANGLTCDYVCCKDAIKVWFIVSHNGASDTDLTLTLNEATNVAAGTTAAVTATCPIWQNTAAGTASDALARLATDAAVITINTSTTVPQFAVIEWDPMKHTAGYDCIALADSGGNASNFLSVVAIIETRLPQAAPPSAIID